MWTVSRTKLPLWDSAFHFYDPQLGFRARSVYVEHRPLLTG